MTGLAAEVAWYFPSASDVFPDVQLQVRGSKNHWGLSYQVCMWPEVPRISQSFCRQMFFLPTYRTVRKILVGE